MQYRVNQKLTPDDYNLSLKTISKELQDSIQYEEHRNNVDAAKKLAVRQFMDYQGFHQMVLGADLKTIKTGEMRELIDAGKGERAHFALVGFEDSDPDKLKNGGSKGTVTDQVNKEPTGLIIEKKVKDASVYERVSTFREFKKTFDKLMGKNTKFENEEEVMCWLETIRDEDLPLIFTMEFEITYLTQIWSILMRWMKAGKFETKRRAYEWFMTFAIKVSALKYFKIGIKNLLKLPEKTELRKLLDEIASKDEQMKAVCDNVKVLYLDK